MSEVEQTQERIIPKIVYEADTQERIKKRFEETRKLFVNPNGERRITNERIAYDKWSMRAARQEIWLAAKKFWDDHSTDRPKAREFAIQVAEKFMGAEHGKEIMNANPAFGGLAPTLLSTMEIDHYGGQVTTGNQINRFQFWCAVEMIAFKVTPGDLEKIYEDPMECARVQAARMTEFEERYPTGTSTAEQKAELYAIQVFDEQNPVIGYNQWNNVRRWAKLYLEAGYPADYCTVRRSSVCLDKPVPPQDAPRNAKPLSFYLTYGIVRLRDAAKPKPRYRPSLYRRNDYFAMAELPDLDTVVKITDGATHIVERNPYLKALADTFYTNASAGTRARIHTAVENMIMMRSFRFEESFSEFITLTENVCFGKQITQGRGYARRSFWRLIPFTTLYPCADKEQPTRQTTHEIIFDCATDMIMRGADPRDYVALHVHGRGGLSAPISAEEYRALTRAEREYYTQLMFHLGSDIPDQSLAPF